MPVAYKHCNTNPEQSTASPGQLDQGSIYLVPIYSYARLINALIQSSRVASYAIVEGDT